MGTIQHHAIVVTGDRDHIRGVRAEVARIAQPTARDHEEYCSCDGLSVSECILLGQANAYASFMVAPDGSKVGWEQSNLGDEIRERIIEYLKLMDVDWAEVGYGELPATVQTHDRGGYYP